MARIDQGQRDCPAPVEVWRNERARTIVVHVASPPTVIADPDVTRLLPLLSADSELIRGGRPRNERTFD